jgi:hypothetical protein
MYLFFVVSGLANVSRLDTSPLSTLAEWTDVLHLSSKWGFAHLRAASLAAIPPLASPVDKLVLARTYSLTDWISSTYVDLLEREEDLTEEEAERMTIKDIVAIAKGRRVIRTSGKVGPRVDIEKAVQSLLPVPKVRTATPGTTVLSSSSATSKHVTPPSSSVTFDTALTPGDPRSLISRWLDQLASSPLSTYGQTCLAQYMQSDPLHISLVLDMVLERSFNRFQILCDEERRRYDIMIIHPSWIHLDQWDSKLLNLDQCQMDLHICNSTSAREAGLRLVGQWSALPTLLSLNLEQQQHPSTASQEWRQLLDRTLFISRCCSPPNGWCIIDYSIFGVFWNAMSSLFTAAAPHQKSSAARLMHSLITQLNGTYIKHSKASWEIDAFYRVLEDARTQAQADTDPNQIELTKALDVRIGV